MSKYIYREVERDACYCNSGTPASKNPVSEKFGGVS